MKINISKKTFQLSFLTGIFLVFYLINFDSPVIKQSVLEAFDMLAEYAKAHVLFCLVPAFFIAGAIMIFLNQQAVIKFLGPKAKKITAFFVASVSGTILAVCSCTVLPIFKGIYKKGAGIGPAVSFLYSGPAINILAIALTAKVLGWKLGLARTVGAIVFAFVIGLLMHFIFRKEDEKRLTDQNMFDYNSSDEEKPMWKNLVFLFSLMGILIFLNWAPSRDSLRFWDLIFKFKYLITAFFTLSLIYSMVKWYKSYELKEWILSTRDFALQILPLLFLGVFTAGFLLGRPGHDSLIPVSFIGKIVGGNSILSNFIASFSGALMYFATLTEVPILQSLLGAGMGQGPALALLLAGPSLSLPSILVINSELGIKKTLVYVILVVVLSTFCGWFFGIIV